MTVEQWRVVLFKQLDLSSLDSWTQKSRVVANLLLAEYHDIFSLDSCELGCTDLAWHVIKVTDDEPFKVRFRWIPPSMVEEVQSHVREMLEAGAICPSQSPWCNAVVLVRKKDGSLHFCIDFHWLKVHMRKNSNPLPHIQSHFYGRPRWMKSQSSIWPLP